MSDLRTVVIVGGGFAGTTLASALQDRLPSGWQLLIISEESYTTFNPMLAEVVGAAVFPEHVVAPIREMLTKARFVMGRVRGIDLSKRLLRCDTLAGSREMAYDHVVLAFGQRANMSLIPGLAERALPLKLVGDAMFVRNRVLQRLARMELTDDPVERRRLGSFVVIGGGFSGVEVAGALSDFLHSAHRYYGRVRREETQVVLLHDGARLLPELPEPLGMAAARSLKRRGVDIRLGARASQVHAESVELADGTMVPTETVVCTIGTRANPLVESLGIEAVRGRIVTAADGTIAHAPGLWAMGDCAALPNALDGRPCPPTAQFAVAQGRHVANNILAAINGKATAPFSYKSRGMMATTGHNKGVAQVFGVPMKGLLAWLAWRGYYLMLMPTLGRKFRIWIEWSWTMFFPLDITHLRFNRTGEIDTNPDLGAPAPMPTPLDAAHR